jgi:alpha-acetolactate decarboxylase
LGLLDSGCTSTILGSKSIELVKSLGLELENFDISVSTADGTKHDVAGHVDVPFEYNGKLVVMPTLIVPSLTKRLILGMDFWKSFDITPTVGEVHLNMDLENMEISEDEKVSEDVVTFHNLSSVEKEQLAQTLKFYRGTTKEILGVTNLLVHDIDTGMAKPVNVRPYQWSPYMQQEVHKEVDRLEKLGIIAPSQSDWSLPVVPVKKANGKMRLCLDSRKLNEITVKDQYPMPHIGRIFGRLEKAVYFSKIDLSEAFHQIPLSEEAKRKCSFAIPAKGFYSYQVLPFGLINSPMSMARLMDKILGDLEPFVFKYIDDIYIASMHFVDHLNLLAEVGRRLTSAGLTINIEKSEFCRKEIKYLGYVINKDGFKPDPEKIKAILNYPAPKTQKEVRRFLGMAGYYRGCIENHSAIAVPLTELTKDKVRFKWGDEANNAFLQLKSKLVSAPVLAPPNFQLNFFLHVDASDVGGSGILMQHQDGKEVVIAYFSTKFTNTQRKYSATEKECLALLLAVEKFKGYIDGVRFFVITDCSAITWLKNFKANGSSRLARWALRLEQYDMVISHRKGKLNVVPDALSRAIEVLTMETNSDWYGDLKKKIMKDPDKYPLFKVVSDKIYKYIQNLKPETDNFFDWKLVVAPDVKLTILNQEHDGMAHLGFKKTLERIRRRYYWPKMIPEIKKYINGCEICKASKTINQNLQPKMGSMKTKADRPFQYISCDYLGPFPRSKAGNTYLIVITDWFSKYTIIKAVRNGESKHLCSIMENEIFLKFSIPEIFYSDNGKQFVSRDFKQLLARYNVKHYLGAFYHAQSNHVERTNKVLNAAIRSYVGENHKNWDNEIEKIALAINTSQHESTKYSPFFINFGREYVFSGNEYKTRRDLDNGLNQTVSPTDIRSEVKIREFDKIFEEVRKNMAKAYETYKNSYNLRKKDISYNVGEIVWRKNFVQSNAGENFCAKLAPKFVKCRILLRKGSNTYQLQDIGGRRNIGLYHCGDFHR